MFCFSACSCTLRAASGFKLALSLTSSPWGVRVETKSGNWSRMSDWAASAAACSRNPIRIVSFSREMPLCRRFFSRKALRKSPLKESSFLVRAACMSTCSMKCTPPRKSSPKYMGAACRADNQVGVRGIKFSATTYPGLAASGFKACWIASLACSCCSVVSNRALSELFSRPIKVGVSEAALSASSTLPKMALSTLALARAGETCTAGASPKKLGRVYKPPTQKAIRMTRYFQMA